MEITSEELEIKKKELNELIDAFFALSKYDTKNKDALIEKIRMLQDEVDKIYNELKNGIG